MLVYLLPKFDVGHCLNSEKWRLQNCPPENQAVKIG